LLVHEDADFARAAPDAGALGYVVKARLASDLLPAIRAAHADRPFISPTVRFDEARLISPDLAGKPLPIERMRLPVMITLVAALLTVSVAAALAASPPLSGVPTQKSVETLALEWFAQMRTGQIDRTQLAADYNAQLTEDAVQAMSRYLKEYEYGASPRVRRF
jgi:hypothetical protein